MEEEVPWKRTGKTKITKPEGGNAYDPKAGQQNQSSSRDRNMSNQQRDRQPNRGGRGQNTGPGNAWGGRDGPKREEPTAKMPQDEHVPVNNFNAQETKDALKQGYNVPPGKSYPSHEPLPLPTVSTNPDVGGTDQKPAAYKPTGKEMNITKVGPWGSKPNNMANGKDFFVELRKQVYALQQQQKQQLQEEGSKASGG